MYKVTAITDQESADGFNLTPVETYVADSGEEAKKTLKKLINDDTVGIIIINDNFLEAIDERLQQKIDKLYRPVVVPVPAKKKVQITDERRSYLSSLIRRAVGFDIKLGE